MKLALRPMSAADRAFVIESWISSYRCCPPFVSRPAWHDAMAPAIGAVLARPDVRVLVAADADATDHLADLFGWLCWMERPRALPAVYYVYVKQAVRRLGIARRLLDRANIGLHTAFPFICTTRIVGTLRAAGKLRNAEHDPRLGRPPQERTHGTTQHEPDADAA